MDCSTGEQRAHLAAARPPGQHQRHGQQQRQFGKRDKIHGLSPSQCSECFAGETRGTATTSTDYLYTSQRQEAEVGLYFYKARFFDPALSRFIQADTIVPQLGQALSYDRYAYVYNNPIKYTDPEGHDVCWEDGYCPTGKYSRSEHIRYLAKYYKIQFTGAWTEDHQWAVVSGSQAAGNMYTMTLGQNWSFMASALNFRQVYGLKGNQSFEFEWGCPNCSKLAFTQGTRHIQFRDMYVDMFKNTTLVFHELMHAFENAMEITGDDGTKSKPARDSLPDELWSTRLGLQSSPKWKWQHSEDLTSGEVFADMGIAWYYDVWDKDPLAVDKANDRLGWMNKYMKGFVNSAISNQR